ncbi:apoptosis-inducing factor 3-like isoform X2 [Mercenaria mercenaria]|uniref:apoptosis-inducing factor 3-like isoform X2 n=1 Tax=Mercenaria mercenaria TaxID=6596 RepID=UPI00234F9541|nr:apoptosis-inducing factor 3-like isoform X2 [Mercenaria mercenaria]XP_053375536.1 apoptosis-inducing factor 3-like isoform X2 [Mercenaria mercenaria]
MAISGHCVRQYLKAVTTSSNPKTLAFNLLNFTQTLSASCWSKRYIFKADVQPAGSIQQQKPVSTTTITMATDMIEAVVCDADELKSGEMKEVDVGGAGTALLVREGADYFAIGPKCSHYGAPLSKGVLCNGKVRCPWHGACFNVKTGDIEDFPGLDSIPSYQVEVSDGKVRIRADKALLANTRRQRSMCKAAAGNKNVVIIGGGPASVACAETLRQEGFQGTVTIYTKDKYIPYDRIKLSKAMDIKPETIALRPAEFYQCYDITVKTDTEVKSVDTSSKSVKFADDSTAKYDSLMIATGGQPRVLPIPGVNLENVFSLRTPDDANKIAEAATGKTVVIIGSSFIGLEVASYMSGKAVYIHVLCRGECPLENVFGKKVGKVFKKMHEEKGIKFHFQAGIKEFMGVDGKLTEAVLSTGTKIPADIAILGVGVVPATGFLKDSGIKMTDRGFIPVNELMATDKADVYAAGDIVEFPLFSSGGTNVNIQHWQMAHAHGRNAAYSIMGRKQPIRSVPYFWTVQYGKSIRYTGYGVGYDDVVVHGDLEEQKFVAFYTKGKDVVAVASLNFDPIVSQAAEMFLAGKKISKDEIMNDPKSWGSRL